MNVDLACRVVEKLAEMGVSQVCLCAGGRNAPLLVALQAASQMKVWHFFEERSAAFFALGRSWSREREPVAVVTTSGTAAGELLPAMMEAYYAGVPLIAVTADRPRSFRGTGAPQSAEQVGLFSHYVKGSFDVATIEEAERIVIKERAPVHLNVCFSEPLLDGPAKVNPSLNGKPAYARKTVSDKTKLKDALSVMRRPLVILSQSPPNHLIAELIETSHCLIYAEAASQQRRAHKNLLRAGAERIPAMVARGSVDGVIRVGAVPTLRFWRDLEDRFASLPVVSVCSPKFSGLSRPSAVFDLNDENLGVLLANLVTRDSSRLGEIREEDELQAQRLDTLLALHPESEPGLMRWLSESIPANSRVFLGNSLPIREWDLAADYAERKFQVHCSRGLNGIDGQISAFIGWAGQGNSNVGIFGDLTCLYDLSAPWILQQAPELDLKIVVINNRGGQIFDRMFGNPWFINSHNLNFEHWANLWGLEYVEGGRMLEAKARQLVVELKPDAAATRAFWREYSQGL